MNERIRTGIIGLGRSGWNIHVNALSKHPKYHIVAVADPLKERQEEAIELLQCKAYEAPEELIADPDIELIVVASPTHLHVSQTIAALQAGKHVVVEKPMARYVEEIDEMITVANETGRLLSCYQPRRYDPDFLTIKQWLEEGHLGEIIAFRSGIYRFQRRNDWQMLRKYGGGELGNTAAHTLDQLLLLMKPGAQLVYADLRRKVSAGDAEDHVKLLLEDDTGCVGEIEVSNAVALPGPSWTIWGTTGSMIIERGEVKAKWFDPSQVDELEIVEGAAEGRRYGSGEEIPWQEKTWKLATEKPQSEAYYDDFAKSVRDGEKIAVTAESVREQIAVMEAARKMTDQL